MSFLKAFRYRRKSSVIHNLDPRSKFLFSLVMMILSIVFTDIVVLLTLFAVQLVLLLLAKALKEWINSLKGLLFFFVIIFLTQLFFSEIPVSERLLMGLIFSLRLLVLSSSMSCFFLSSTPEDIGRAMSAVKFPLEITFSFIMAMRFIPVIYDEFQSIYDTQRSRGLELEKGGFMERIRNFIPILIPLLVNTIRRTYEIADAMEIRAFGASLRRTSFKQLRFRRGDYLLCLFSVILMILGVYLKLINI
ncbi:MAG: energy-coupling factor transporter transmembrane component T family protein [Thermoproteota archaeon]